MQTTRFTRLSGLALAVLLILLVGQGLVFGHDDRDRKEPRKLEGAWNVTLQFGRCDDSCPCPGGKPNIPIPGLHMYLKHGSFLEVPGGSLFRGPGLGAWERLGHHQFEARFKFFLFKPDGSPRGNEEVTSRIDFTGHDTFEAKATFDLFLLDEKGELSRTSPDEGCPITEEATRFE